MIPRINYFFLMLLLIVSCNNKNSVSNVSEGNIVIDIQPFKGISPYQTQYVFTELKKIYSFIEIKKTIVLPGIGKVSSTKPLPG